MELNENLTYPWQKIVEDCPRTPAIVTKIKNIINPRARNPIETGVLQQGSEPSLFVSLGLETSAVAGGGGTTIAVGAIVFESALCCSLSGTTGVLEI